MWQPRLLFRIRTKIYPSVKTVTLDNIQAAVHRQRGIKRWPKSDLHNARLTMGQDPVHSRGLLIIVEAAPPVLVDPGWGILIKNLLGDLLLAQALGRLSCCLLPAA